MYNRIARNIVVHFYFMPYIFSAYSLSSGSQANGNIDNSNNKELNRTLSEDNHGDEVGSKMEDAPQNPVIKNIKSDILNGFPQRRNDEGGFKVCILNFH